MTQAPLLAGLDWLAPIGAGWRALREQGLSDRAADFGLRLLGALLVVLVGMRLIKLLCGLLQRAMDRAGLEPTAAMFLRKVAQVGLMVILLLAALQLLGVPMTSMFAVLGAAGLAIGLALKDSLSNIASGVMLVSLKPFRVGDVVTVAGQTGKVEGISIFQTRLRGADNQHLFLPNSLITTAAIINMTPEVMRRVELVVGIGYDDSIERARAIALGIMHADPRVLADPAPDVLVYALADSSVQLGIRCHVRNDDYFVAKCELLEKIKLAFDAAQISFPFPQRVMHVVHADAGTAKGPVPAASLGDPRHRPSADPE
jgi:small conductance mechanosensitive channel